MSVKTEVLLEKEFGGKSTARSDVQTASLAAAEVEEIKQTNLETRIYDREARFFDYGEASAATAETKTESRRSRRVFLPLGLLAVGGLSLIAGLATGIYALSEKMLESATFTWVNILELPPETPAEKSGDKNASPDASASEKILKSNDAKVFEKNDDVGGKEPVNTAETKTEKAFVADGNKIPPPSPKPSEASEADLSGPLSKTSNPTFSKETPDDSETDFSMNSRPGKTSPTAFVSRRNRQTVKIVDNRDDFTRFPNARREREAEKYKPLKPGLRNKLRNMLLKKRRMN